MQLIVTIGLFGAACLTVGYYVGSFESRYIMHKVKKLMELIAEEIEDLDAKKEELLEIAKENNLNDYADQIEG